MFTPLPSEPDSNALELEILDRWEREGTFEQLREQNRGGPKWSFIDGPVTANKNARRAHGVGPDAEGRLPALQGAARLRPALPERLRLPGALDRGRRRARSSGLNSKREIEEFGLEEFAAPLPRGRRQVGRGADARLEAARPVDGLGQRLLHLQRHEHRVHLAVPEDRRTSAAGSTSATARPSGARAAARRSRSTS